MQTGFFLYYGPEDCHAFGCFSAWSGGWAQCRPQGALLANTQSRSNHSEYGDRPLVVTHQIPFIGNLKPQTRGVSLADNQEAREGG